jgi:hypothetical protein
MLSRVETGCLDTRTVIAFVGGRLDERTVAAVTRHMEACRECAENAEMAASSAGDTVVMGGAVQQDPPLGPGAMLGRYEVRAWIGQGGMGHVYEGFDPELERKVALKVLRSRGTFGDDERSQKRLAREAKTMARLSNPHVVAVHDVGMFAGRVFLVMELVEGTTLADWLGAKKRPWRDILAAFVAAGEGLAAAHEIGIVHRDFKPQNVLVGTDGTVRVTDFGLARPQHAQTFVVPAMPTRDHADATVSMTGTAGPVGTPRYMAPEQRLGAPSDARADQYSFCVALCEALCMPHAAADDPAESLRTALARGRSAASLLKSARVPGALAAALVRGLSGAPDDRFPSMSPLLSALLPEPGARFWGRRRVGAAVALGLTAAAAFVWWLTTTARPTILEPEGEAADWSESPVVARLPGQVHCFSRLDARTVRVIWGDPRRAEDIDVRTGSRRSSDLTPESFRHGCPSPSPNGRELLFEGYDHENRPHIFHSPHPDGRRAEPVVPTFDPMIGSEPQWLASGKDFVFDPGLQHPAVFSLEKKRTRVISDRPQLGPTEYLKFTNSRGNLIGVAYVADDRALLSFSFYKWPGFDLTTRFDIRICCAVFPVWHFGENDRYVYGQMADGSRRMVALDLQEKRMRFLGKIAGAEIPALRQLDNSTTALLALWKRSEVRYHAAERADRLIMAVEGIVYDWTVTTNGNVFLSQGHPNGSSLHIYRPENDSIQELDRGPYWYSVSAIQDGDWLLSRVGSGKAAGFYRCKGASLNCQRLHVPILSQPWVAAPNGARAVAWNDGSLQVLNLADGTVTDTAIGRVAFCRVRWAGPSALWFKDLATLLWTELDVDRMQLTGRTRPGTGGTCIDGIPDPTLPPEMTSPVRVSVTVASEIRVRPFRAP